MRLPNIFVACWLLSIVLPSWGVDTSAEEKTCANIGFKKGTEKFGNCVLELIGRKSSTSSTPQATSSPDDQTCLKYGFKPDTNDFATCKQQIDMARKEAQQRQTQYQAQLKEYQRQREINANLALMSMGFGMMSGGSPSAVPPPPMSSSNMSRTYILPGGRMMTCTTTGSITNCF